MHEKTDRTKTIFENYTQLGELRGTLAQVEAEVDSLLNHTNAGVEELLNE